MLRQDRLTVLDQAEGRLQLPAHRQQVGRILEAARQPQRRGRVAAGAAKNARSPGHDPHDRVVNAIGDGAIMRQRKGRDIGKLSVRLRVVDDCGLVRDIAARHHERMFELIAPIADAAASSAA